MELGRRILFEKFFSCGTYGRPRCLHCGQCQTECDHADCKSFGRCIYICPENCLEIVGKQVTAKELAKELKQSAEIIGEGVGGFTFSGGEPLAQPKFLFELIEELKDYHLCIETSGYANSEIFNEILEKFDFIIMDIKLADSKFHKLYTGVGNEQILKNLEILKSSQIPYIIRTPLIPDITDEKNNLEKNKELIGNSKWEQVPYNQLAGAKYKMLGMKYKII